MIEFSTAWCECKGPESTDECRVSHLNLQRRRRRKRKKRTKRKRMKKRRMKRTKRTKRSWVTRSQRKRRKKMPSLFFLSMSPESTKKKV